MPFPSGLGVLLFTIYYIEEVFVTINEAFFIKKPFSNIKLPWKRITIQNTI
jgi:hypothetical protein